MEIDVLTVVVSGFVFISIGMVFVFLSLRWFNTDEVESRVNEFVDVQGSQLERLSQVTTVQRDLSGSLGTRVFLPIVRRFTSLLGRFTPAGSMENIAKSLIVAGSPGRLGAREFYGIRLLFLIIGVLVGIIVSRLSDNRISLLLGVILTIIFYYLPNIWLRFRIQNRQKMMSKSFPDAMDMLSVCATAGLGFDQALQRVSEHWGTAVGAEFGRVVSEMEMGLSRKEALRNMADRVDLSAISSFVSLIIQSDQLGMSISDTLHTQADQMRIERRFRAQEEARKIPTKMLFPMAFMIFPAIFAVVLGPAVPQLLEFFQTF